MVTRDRLTPPEQLIGIRSIVERIIEGIVWLIRIDILRGTRG
jgi:hypothetical protein